MESTSRTTRSICLGLKIHSDTVKSHISNPPAFLADTRWLWHTTEHTVENKRKVQRKKPTSQTGLRSLRSQHNFSSFLQASRPQNHLFRLKWLLRALQFCRYWSSEKYLIIFTYQLCIFCIWRFTISISIKKKQEIKKKFKRKSEKAMKKFCPSYGQTRDKWCHGPDLAGLS